MWLLIYVFCSKFTLDWKKLHLIHVKLFKYSHIWIFATERSGREHTSCGCVSTSYCQPPPTTDGSGIIDIRIVTRVRRLKVCCFLNQDSHSYKSVRFRIEATCFGDRHRMKMFCRGTYCSQATAVIFLYIWNQYVHPLTKCMVDIMTNCWLRCSFLMQNNIIYSVCLSLLFLSYQYYI
jgi:hypothetical protein